MEKKCFYEQTYIYCPNNTCGIFIFSRKVIDCSIVDSPPKLITKLARIIASFKFCSLEISMHPFVISMLPCKTSLIGEGKRLKMGLNAVITTKKIAIITPTESILSAESITICDKSCLVTALVIGACPLSFALMFR